MVFLRNAVFAAAALLSASSATAMTAVYLQSAGIYNPGTVNVTTGSSTTNDYASAIKFIANIGPAASAPGFDLLGFCVDLFHNISVGINGQTPVDLHYHVAKLLTDSNGVALTTAQKQQIGGLATLGFAIAAGSSPDKFADLAAIQGAIWTIEYPGSSFAASGGYADLQTRIDGFVALAPSLSGVARAIYADDGRTQGFIVGGGVPEPATWAMLLGGFAMVGAAARRRQRTLATVTA